MTMRVLLVSLLFALTSTCHADSFRSHSPVRPLPVASKRPMADTKSYFVDPKKGDDSSEGSKVKPWKTVTHATAKLTAGTTLYLRDGVYHEHLTLSLSGKSDQPITIRSYPGELAVIDGGYP